MSSFTKKQLRVTLLFSGTNQVFPGTNSNTLKLQNMRMTADVEQSARFAPQAVIRIFGMKQADMDAATVAWAIAPIVADRQVILEANSTGKSTGWTQVYKGTLIEAQPDYRDAPNVPFVINATSGYFPKINPVPPTSYPETVDIGVAAQDIIEAMGAPWTYVDGGATGVLTNPYFAGTLWDQLAQACSHAKADFYVQGDQILVTPFGRPKVGAGPSIVLSPTSGLIGYPMFGREGLSVLALYDPAYSCGIPIDVKNSLVPATNGRWYPYSMRFMLEAQNPDGAWFATLKCNKAVI